MAMGSGSDSFDPVMDWLIDQYQVTVQSDGFRVHPLGDRQTVLCESRQLSDIRQWAKAQMEVGNA